MLDVGWCHVPSHAPSILYQTYPDRVVLFSVYYINFFQRYLYYQCYLYCSPYQELISKHASKLLANTKQEARASICSKNQNQTSYLCTQAQCIVHISHFTLSRVKLRQCHSTTIASRWSRAMVHISNTPIGHFRALTKKLGSVLRVCFLLEASYQYCNNLSSHNQEQTC